MTYAVHLNLRRHLGFALVHLRGMHLIEKPVSMPLNLFAYMNKLGLSIRPILLTLVMVQGFPHGAFRQARTSRGWKKKMTN